MLSRGSVETVRPCWCAESIRETASASSTGFYEFRHGVAVVMANVTIASDGDFLAEVSRRWVDETSTRLTQTGRRLEGGWPGTMSEARRLLAYQLAAPATNVSRPEFEYLVKTVYDDAKRRWRAVAERSSPTLDY